MPEGPTVWPSDAAAARTTSLALRLTRWPVSPIGIVGCPMSVNPRCSTRSPEPRRGAGRDPFATIEPNTGVVAVPDERLPWLADVRIILRDGDVRGHRGDRARRQRGSGAGQQVPVARARVRRHLPGAACVQRPDVVHVEGRVSPADDMETINTERSWPTCRLWTRPSRGSRRRPATTSHVRRSWPQRWPLATSWTPATRSSRPDLIASRCANCSCSRPSRSSM